MLLKISLGLAILAGLVTLYVSHFQVAGNISALKEDLESTRGSLQTSQQNEARLNKDLRTVRGQLDDSVRAFGEATNELAQVQAKAQEQQTRADRASAELNNVTAERNQAQQELSQWRLFEMTPDQIRNNLARLRNVERERDVFTTENKALTRKIASLQGELRRYTGEEEQEVVLPPGTRGTVIAVDPKYDFVVLDVGGNQGILENARLLVNREGQLIGKVKITSVEPNRSIANVLPEWKQEGAEIMEGDQVFF
jgi:ABC-type transporter Mla subunit MlaD